MTDKEFLAYLRRICADEASQARLAERAGISSERITDVLSGREDAPEKLLRALHVKKQYIKDCIARMIVHGRFLEVSFDQRDKNWQMLYSGRVLYFGEDATALIQKARHMFGWTNETPADVALNTLVCDVWKIDSTARQGDAA